MPNFKKILWKTYKPITWLHFC